jgi:hypothetical protein
MVLHCYSISSFVQRSGDGDVESLLDLTSFMPPHIHLFLLCPSSSFQGPYRL